MPDHTADLLVRVRQHVPTDEHVRNCWPWLARAVEIGWLHQEELDELIGHLRAGRDFGVEELLFEHVGDALRVSFHDEEERCRPETMLAALAPLARDGDAHVIEARWQTASRKALQAIPESSAVALQAYLLAQMSGADVVLRGRAALDLTKTRMQELYELLAPVFDDPTCPADEYWRWLGPPIESSAIDAPGSFARSMRSSWTLSAWPSARFAVSAHPDGHAWDVRFEAGDGGASLVPGITTFDRLQATGAQIQDLDHWPPMREVLATYSDGHSVRARFDFGLLQSVSPVSGGASAET